MVVLCDVSSIGYKLTLSDRWSGIREVAELYAWSQGRFQGQLKSRFTNFAPKRVTSYLLFNILRLIAPAIWLIVIWTAVYIVPDISTVTWCQLSFRFEAGHWCTIFDIIAHAPKSVNDTNHQHINSMALFIIIIGCIICSFPLLDRWFMPTTESVRTRNIPVLRLL